MTRRRGSRGEPSQRQLRVGESVRHVLVELLRRETHAVPAFAEASLTVSEVRVSRDLRHAEVFVTALGGELDARHLQALTALAPRLRGSIARQLHLKYAPELVFHADTLFTEAAHLEALIARERAALETGNDAEIEDGTVQA